LDNRGEVAEGPYSIPLKSDIWCRACSYCIHPRDTGQYLVVSTGIFSAVYDAHGSVFLDKNIYGPDSRIQVLRTDATLAGDLRASLSGEIQDTHRVGPRRARDCYDKGPSALFFEPRRVRTTSELLKEDWGVGARAPRGESRSTSRRLRVEGLDQDRAAWRHEQWEQMDVAAAYASMDSPLPPGALKLQYFVAE